jgi:Uri superfamily endonuclease
MRAGEPIRFAGGRSVALPEGKGTYILILHLPEYCRLGIGSLGWCDFSAGHYAYVGSATAPGGLAARLRHHARPAPTPRWHIDTLRQAADIEQIWYSRSETSREHEWAGLLAAMRRFTAAVPRFGASDCSCPTHLFRALQRPSLAAFARRHKRRFPQDAPVRSLTVRGSIF